jgi:hypothetical protein
MREYIGDGITAEIRIDGSVALYFDDDDFVEISRASLESLLKLIEKGKLK